MKNLLALLAAVILTSSAFAQAPEKMSYQAVVRDAGNALITDQAVGMQISILQGSASGTAVYVETQTPNTNINGLVSIEIGSGTVVSGAFNTIDWSNGPYFIKTETDPTGSTNYTIEGTSKLLSVPYAMYAKTSGSSTPGPQGLKGDTGLTGAMGPQGLKGDTGVAGIQGIQGIQGLKGDTGVAGIQGIQGIQGLKGDTGVAGLQGLIGLTGPQGLKGDTGVIITPVYTVGLWPELGGYVFWVSPDGKHGLVSETQDQGLAVWYFAQDLISDPTNHSSIGQKFRDWRLPTKHELNEMYSLSSAIGSFGTNTYWTSIRSGSTTAWRQNFLTGGQFNTTFYTLFDFFYVRSVREF